MNLAFGRYLKNKSIIHQMDPRLKFFMSILLIVSIFLNTGFVGYFILTIGLLFILFFSKLPIKIFLRILKPIIFIILFLFVVNCFLIKPSSDPSDPSIGLLFSLNNIFVISWRCILQAIYIGYRVFLMMIITTLLTATTKPLDLTLAIEDLLSPLKLIKVPVHIISTIISIAFRMIPTLLEEAGRIMKAQASRGVDYNNGKFNDKVRSLVSLIVPLLVSSFQKAEDLAYAMDSRGYNPYNSRTRYRKFKITIIDILLFLFGSGLAILIFVQFNLNFIPNIPYIDQYIV